MSWPGLIIFPEVGAYAHGELRSFHQQSTYPDEINFQVSRGTNFVTLTPQNPGGDETFVVHRVGVPRRAYYLSQDGSMPRGGPG